MIQVLGFAIFYLFFTNYPGILIAIQGPQDLTFDIIINPAAAQYAIKRHKVLDGTWCFLLSKRVMRRKNSSKQEGGYENCRNADFSSQIHIR